MNRSPSCFGVLYHRATWSSILLVPALVMMGCSGGGSSDDDPDDDDNGNGDPANGGSGETASLVYEHPRDSTSGETNQNVIDLELIRSDDPQNPVATAGEEAVDNFDWSDRERPQGAPSPDSTTFPMGVFRATFEGDAFADAHYPYVVFNSTDGHLYRMDVEDDEGTAVRVSSEDEAGIVCSASVLSHHTDTMQSVIVYELADDDECRDDQAATTLRAVRLGDDESDSPVTLRDTVDANDALAELSGSYAEALHDAEGSITGYLIQDGTGSLTLHDPDGTEVTELQSDVDEMHSLGWLGADNTPLIYVDGDLAVVDEDDEQLDDLGESISGNIFPPENSAIIGDDTYIVDVESSFSDDDGRILRVHEDSGPIEVEEVHNWGGTSVETLVTTEDHLAWAYEDEAGTNVDTLDLDGHIASDLRSSGDYSFPLFSPGAPGDDNSDGWLFYQDHDEGAAKAVEISGAGSTQEIVDARWAGSTWEQDPDTVRDEAQFVFFVEEVNGEETLRARPATDALGEHTVTFDNQPDELDLFYVGSYGAPSLLGLTESQRPDVHYIDPTDPASLQQLTDRVGFDNRAVPWY